jgi:hypothetical protein
MGRAKNLCELTHVHPSGEDENDGILGWRSDRRDHEVSILRWARKPHGGRHDRPQRTSREKPSHCPRSNARRRPAPAAGSTTTSSHAPSLQGCRNAWPRSTGWRGSTIGMAAVAFISKIQTAILVNCADVSSVGNATRHSRVGYRAILDSTKRACRQVLIAAGLE